MPKNNRIAQKTDLFRLYMTDEQYSDFLRLVKITGKNKTRLLTEVLTRLIEKHSEVISNGQT